MLILWILFTLIGLSSAAWAMLVWGFGLGPSLLVGIGVLLALRGLVSVIRRRLVLTERLAEEADVEQRTLETNRYIFWRRVLWIAVLLSIYSTVFYYLFRHTDGSRIYPGEALLLLPGLILQALPQASIFLIFMLAQFAIFFVPF